MRKLIGIVGSGMIGRDPFDPDCWSRCARHFFLECQKLALLERAFGVEAPPHVRWPLILRNFSIDRARWTKRFYLDARYYAALTREIAKRLQPGDYACDMLQLGGIYDVPSIVRGRARCYSFHDGNLAQLSRSPYMPRGIPARHVDRALSYERRVYAGIDRIFTMSEYLRRSFIDDFDVPSDKVVCIGAGVNIEAMPPLVDKAYDTKQILFVGVDFERKGGVELLQAFRVARQRDGDLTLHVVGPRALEVPVELAAGVEVHGFLSRDDPEQHRRLRRLWREASLFVLPSLYEPFGVAALEAMAHQIPCVLSDRWAFPEMVDEGRNGALVGCGNVEALASALTELTADPERLARMGASARRFVESRFTWESVARRMAAAIEVGPQGNHP